jgi:hypothetical protein
MAADFSEPISFSGVTGGWRIRHRIAGSIRAASRFRRSSRSAMPAATSLKAPEHAIWTFPLFRNIYLSRGETPKQLQIRGEVFNITNTPQFNNPNTTIGVNNTGVTSSAGSPTSFQRIQRQIQLGVKFLF